MSFDCYAPKLSGTALTARLANYQSIAPDRFPWFTPARVMALGWHVIRGSSVI